MKVLIINCCSEGDTRLEINVTKKEFDFLDMLFESLNSKHTFEYDPYISVEKVVEKEVKK